MVQMFLYVDLMIACRISLEIKQCLRDLVSSLAKTNPLSFCFVTVGHLKVYIARSQKMSTNPAETAHKTSNTKLL